MGSVTIIQSASGSGETLASYRSDHAVSYWPCDDASGDLTDSIGSNDLSTTGTPTYAQAGKGGNGIQINANGDFFSAQSTDFSPGLDDFFVTMWIKTTTSGTKNICNFASSLSLGTPNAFIQTQSATYGRVGFNSSAVGIGYNPSNFFNDGTPHHWAWGRRRNSSGYYEFLLFIDGVKVCGFDSVNNPDLSNSYFVLGRTAGDTVLDGVYNHVHIMLGDGSIPSQAILDAMVTEHD